MDHKNKKAEILNECEKKMKQIREENNAKVEMMGVKHLGLVHEHDEVKESLKILSHQENKFLF